MMRLPFLFFALPLLGARAACTGRGTDLRLTVVTDKYPQDTYWQLKSIRKNKVWWNHTEVVKHTGQYKARTRHTHEKCLSNGKYEFNITDSYGDGLCCKEGNGSYQLEMLKNDGNWTTLLHGGLFKKEEANIVYVGASKGNRWRNRMTAREKDYLKAHNVRRKTYHEGWNTTYVPLKWSPKLRAWAKRYADVSVAECMLGIPARHGEKQPYGENVASNKGATGTAWAVYKSPDGYVHQFVDREAKWDPPKNGHESLAMWRSTQYVGCADSTIGWKPPNRRHTTCHRVVCRFAKPGNCKIGKGEFDWEKEAQKNNTHCGPMCPPEGCFHAEELD